VIEGLIESQADEIVEILDLIFKWSNLRMSDSQNTKLLMAIMGMFEKVIDFLIEREYTLQSFEAEVLMASLTVTCGINNKSI
jgi:hypothetical protein